MAILKGLLGLALLTTARSARALAVHKRADLDQVNVLHRADNAMSML